MRRRRFFSGAVAAALCVRNGAALLPAPSAAISAVTSITIAIAAALEAPQPEKVRGDPRARQHIREQHRRAQRQPGPAAQRGDPKVPKHARRAGPRRPRAEARRGGRVARAERERARLAEAALQRDQRNAGELRPRAATEADERVGGGHERRDGGHAHGRRNRVVPLSAGAGGGDGVDILGRRRGG